MKVEKIHQIDGLPTIIEKEIKDRRKEEFYDTFLYENNLYLVASLGQKCTAGYEVSMENLKEIDVEEWEIMMQKKEPVKDQVVSQVITTPLIVLKVMVSEGKSIPKRIIFKNKKGEVMQGITVKEKDKK